MYLKLYNKISIIIPCYNEEKNIVDLKKKCKIYENKKNFEVFLINNGSSDNTLVELKKKFDNAKNFQILNIKKNNGFGNAIKLGIKSSSTKIIAYTHADQETDQSEIYKFLCKKKLGLENVYIKGLRQKRNLMQKIFTYLMSLFVLVVFRRKLHDIHAQPNIFNKKIFKNISLIPNDFSIDTYVYLKHLEKNKRIVRYKVNSQKRKFGIGNNDGVNKKIINSIKEIWSILKMKFYTDLL